MIYRVVAKSDYHKEVNIGKKNKIRCYSLKDLHNIYPLNDFKIIGEVTKSDEKQKGSEQQIELGNQLFPITYLGKHSRLRYRKAGYVCVGDDNYVALLSSRLPFLLTLFGLLLAIICTALILWNIMTTPANVIKPYNPLPEPDSNAEGLGDGTDDSSNDNTDGGTVSMIYSLDVKLDLSTKQAEIYFQNPSASNHAVVLQLYIISEDKETMIAESGLIKAGNGLYQLSMIDGSAVLSEGLYKGKYKVIFYNPNTGEKALVESDITDLTITAN